MEANDARRRQGHLILVFAGTGVAATLLFLPWLRYAISVPGAGSFELTQNGLHAEPEWLGWLALLTAVAVAVGAGWAEAAAARRDPAWPRYERLLAVLSIATAGLVLAKFVSNVSGEEQDFLGTGARISVGLAVLLLALGVVIAVGGRSATTRGG